MRKRTIKTPVVKYWKFDKSPFGDKTLNKETMHLFINREVELNELSNSISNVITGIYGGQGVGKSSFLAKFYLQISKEYPSIYVKAGISELTIYRDLLESVLKGLKNNIVKISRIKGFDIEQEIIRLEHTSSKTIEGQIGGKFIAEAKYIEKGIDEIGPHSEVSALNLLRKIFENLSEPLIIFIDDLERLRTFIDTNKNYLRFITSLARTIDEALGRENVAFILSLDSFFYDEINKDKMSNDDASHSFSRFIELGSFPPKYFKAFLFERLKDSGWEASFNEFITLDAFWLLTYFTKGHPRRALNFLQQAIELVEREKLPLLLTSDIIISIAKKLNYSINDKEVEVIQYLAINGPHSPSDKSFQEIASRGYLIKLINSIEDNGLMFSLIKEEAGSNRSKELYALPNLD